MTETPVAFADIMRQHWKSVWSFIYSIVKRTDIADDLAQETFIRAYQHWEDYRGDASIKTWLFTIGKHVATDYLRSAAVRRLIPFSNPHIPRRRNRHEQDEQSAESKFVGKESVNAIWQSVLTLNKTARAVVTLRIREELSFAEISQILNISEGNARVHYHRAIRTLRTKLQAEVLANGF